MHSYKPLSSYPADLKKRRQMIEDEELELQIALDMIRWKLSHVEAEEIVRDQGWTEEDDDFDFQIEMESRRLDEEKLDEERDLWRRRFL